MKVKLVLGLINKLLFGEHIIIINNIYSTNNSISNDLNYLIKNI